MNNHEIMIKLDKLTIFKRILHRTSTKHLDMHMGQLPILEFIKHNPGCTQIEISNTLMITPASVALSTKRMEREKLLEKKIDKDNLRCKRLYITQKGMEVSDKCRQTFDETDAKIFEGISAEDFNAFSEILDKLIANLSKEVGYNVSELDFCAMHALKHKMEGKNK